MSCYFRHLGDVFAAAGIEVTKEDRPGVNAAVVSALGKDLAHCPEIWREVKIALASDEATFIARLRDAWSSRSGSQAAGGGK